MSLRPGSGAVTLVGMLLAAGTPAPAADALPGWTLQAPELGVEQQVVTARAGFLLRTADGWTLIGDAVRWDLASGELFATGRIALTIPPTRGERASPGLRLEADHIGLVRPPAGAEDPAIAERGEAWNVQLFLRVGQRLMRLRAERARLTRDSLVLEGVSGDGGHGGVLGIAAGRLTIALRGQEAEDRAGFERHVAAIELRHLRPSLAGVPVFYTPWLYRDFTRDYPWTRYRFGQSDRLGWFGQAWTRVDPPPLADWRLRQQLRLDHYSEAGTPWGARSEWWHPRLGEGEFLYYGFDLTEERIYRSADQDRPLGEVHHRLFDAEHRVSWPGGGGYARYTDLPEPDPGAPADERFRNDYLEDDLAHRPLARRGASAAISWPWLSLVADTDRAPLGVEDEVDRLYALELVVPTWRLLGPLYVAAEAGAEGLEQETLEDRASRVRYRAGLGAEHWLPFGLGLGAELGVAGLAYLEPELAGSDLDDQQRAVPTAAARLSYQLVGRFGEYQHRLVPRVELQLRGEGEGDALDPFRFDQFDQLDEDRRELAVGFDTDLSRSRVLLRLSATTRWGLRDEDLPAGRSEAEDLGQHLRAVEFDLHGSPIATLNLDAQGSWDGEQRDWDEFDGGLRWTAHYRLQLRGRATWRQEEERWQYRPGLTVVGDRYRLETDLVFEEDRDEPRSLRLGLGRRFVDGTLDLGYEIQRAEDGEELEQRFSVAFSLDTFSLY